MSAPRRDRRSKRRAEAAERQAARDTRSDLEQITVVLARGATVRSPEVVRLQGDAVLHDLLARDRGG